MRYLTGQELIFIHAAIIEETGGLHGVREIGQMLFALNRPKQKVGGREVYPGVYQKAAAKKLTLDEIAAWFKTHAKPLAKPRGIKFTG